MCFWLVTPRGVALLRHRLPDNLGLANQTLRLSSSFCRILRPEETTAPRQEIVSFALRAVLHSGLVLNDECCSTGDCSWNPKVAFVATRPTAAYCGYRSVNDELHTDSPFSRCYSSSAGVVFPVEMGTLCSPLPLTNLLFDGGVHTVSYSQRGLTFTSTSALIQEGASGAAEAGTSTLKCYASPTTQTPPKPATPTKPRTTRETQVMDTLRMNIGGNGTYAPEKGAGRGVLHLTN